MPAFAAFRGIQAKRMNLAVAFVKPAMALLQPQTDLEQATIRPEPNLLLLSWESQRVDDRQMGDQTRRGRFHNPPG
jgi:hypothetical protein